MAAIKKAVVVGTKEGQNEKVDELGGSCIKVLRLVR